VGITHCQDNMHSQHLEHSSTFHLNDKHLALLFEYKVCDTLQSNKSIKEITTSNDKSVRKKERKVQSELKRKC